MSFIQALNLKRAEALAHDSEPWRLPLERLRGQVGDDGVERVTTQRVLDLLEIPQRARRAGTYRRLAKLMTELGWSAVRVRGPTRGGYLNNAADFPAMLGIKRLQRDRSGARPIKTQGVGAGVPNDGARIGLRFSGTSPGLADGRGTR